MTAGPARPQPATTLAPVTSARQPGADILDDLPPDAAARPANVVDLRDAADARLMAYAVAAPTEHAVSLLFEHRHAQRLRYCEVFGHWLEWDGARWRPERTSLAFDFARGLASEVNAHGKASVAKKSFAAGVEAFARAARCFATLPDQWDRSEWLMNTPTGTVDLQCGELRPHAQPDHLTKVTRVSPQPGQRPAFDKFMHEICCGDASLVAYLQRALGATLSGARADHWLQFWIGAGRNGKNTLGDLVEWILGDYARTIPAETLMSSRSDRHPTELANLRGVRLAVSSEVPEGCYWNETRIKQLTGDATIAARFMRADFFTFERGHKHLIYGNHRPQLRAVDDAIRSRMHVVPFRATFSDELGNRDPELPAKLRAEAPQILQWLIEGHLSWIEDGHTLRKCAAVEQETSDYLEAQSTPALWVQERCELRSPDDRPGSVLDTASELYRAYAAWKKARGEDPMSQTRWSEWMAGRFRKERQSRGVVYRGLRLIPTELDPPHWHDER